jgi:hypothetical protein
MIAVMRWRKWCIHNPLLSDLMWRRGRGEQAPTTKLFLPLPSHIVRMGSFKQTNKQTNKQPLKMKFLLFQHRFIDLFQYLCCVLQHQLIVLNTQNQLKWNMLIVNNISIHISTLIIMNEHNLHIIHTIKLWNDFKLKTQLHNCSQMITTLHSQSIVRVVSWFTSIH